VGVEELTSIAMPLFFARPEENIQIHNIGSKKYKNPFILLTNIIQKINLKIWLGIYYQIYTKLKIYLPKQQN
jgi:hypothetical protein